MRAAFLLGYALDLAPRGCIRTGTPPTRGCIGTGSPLVSAVPPGLHRIWHPGLHWTPPRVCQIWYLGLYWRWDTPQGCARSSTQGCIGAGTPPTPPSTRMYQIWCPGLRWSWDPSCMWQSWGPPPSTMHWIWHLELHQHQDPHTPQGLYWDWHRGSATDLPTPPSRGTWQFWDPPWGLPQLQHPLGDISTSTWGLVAAWESGAPPGVTGSSPLGAPGPLRVCGAVGSGTPTAPGSGTLGTLVPRPWGPSAPGPQGLPAWGHQL